MAMASEGMDCIQLSRSSDTSLYSILRPSGCQLILVI